MPVTYYPAQVLTVLPGGQLELIQSADVDFAISRQDVFEFGNLYAVDNIQVEPATVTLNFSYALSSGDGVTPTNASKLGMDDFDTFLNDQGKNYGISGAGALIITSGIVKSYSVEGSVGNIPTVSVSVDATNATYTAGNPVFKGDAGFSGTYTLEVFNVALWPILIEKGGRIGQLVFQKIKKGGKGYHGRYNGQAEPQPSK